MASIPTILPTGVILIYGWGNEQSFSGIVPDNTDFVFGSVYNVWDGGRVYVYGGDEVMWKKGTEQARLIYQGNPYTQIPARLVSKQEIIP